MLRSRTAALTVAAVSLLAPAAAQAAWSDPEVFAPKASDVEVALAPGGHLALGYQAQDAEDDNFATLASRAPWQARFDVADLGPFDHSPLVAADGTGTL